MLSGTIPAMDHAHTKLMEARAKLQRAGEHWQRCLTQGLGSWEGDRALVLYYMPLTHTIEVWYELPNHKPEVVIKDVPADEFDIHKMCQRLHQASNRNSSVEDKIKAADAHNDKLILARSKQHAEQQAEAAENLARALAHDTGFKKPRLVVP